MVSAVLCRLHREVLEVGAGAVSRVGKPHSLKWCLVSNYSIGPDPTIVSPQGLAVLLNPIL